GQTCRMRILHWPKTIIGPWVSLSGRVLITSTNHRLTIRMPGPTTVQCLVLSIWQASPRTATTSTAAFGIKMNTPCTYCYIGHGLTVWANNLLYSFIRIIQVPNYLSTVRARGYNAKAKHQSKHVIA